ncbi:MAG TPA: UPF0175 family protein [Phycisphaerae bacterium]|nr:UPF0175 family protein [Phycisphaerae bacterium]HOM51324.1 UPF0175 family protein [Phycisphaerae bacterium]HOQ86970.1 UPF0175 family protein [Phycisphaerae bacterium]HPU27791.1 UPF0175 family protein [Phycisphaerae bacterium]HQA00358.1 UPF0175 family protein [Phycisphaerae bacterium]
MTIVFTLPPSIEQRLLDEGQDPNQAAKEAALVDLYRREKISHGEHAQALGISRFDTDALLKRHGVTEDLLTAEELEDQLTSLFNLLKR